MTQQTRLESTAQTQVEGIGGTRIETADAAVRPGMFLPSMLIAQYDIVRPFDTMGAEADLALIRRRADGVQHVLKLYRRGLKPKLDVIEALRTCDAAYVVETIKYGESDGLWFEVLEYGAHGTLREWMASGPIKPSDMMAVLSGLFEAIAHIHQKQIIHRDLKPENVLIRKKKPLNLVLTDFGIASKSDATQHFTTRSRTVKYGAPEAAAGSVGTGSDYWSLGLMILEGLTGKHPFEGLSDVAIAYQLVTGKVDVSVISHARWRNLCQGLLIREPKKRWGAEQVQKWIAGENPPVHADELDRPSQKPYKIAKQECHTGMELALALARNWKEGERHLARGLILPWLREELRDQDAANLLIDLNEDKALKPDDRLVRLIAGLGKGLPPVWRGTSLDAESLSAICHGVLKGDSTDQDFIADLYQRKVLEVWATAGNEECAEWQRLWVQASDEFPRKWDEVVTRVSLDKTRPSARLLLSAALLLIVSKTYRQTLAEEIVASVDVLARCDWFAPILSDLGTAATLLRHYLKADAQAAGQLEIESAKKLNDVLKKLASDFEETLFREPALRSELQTLTSTIGANRARYAIEESYPVLRERLFEASRRSSVRRALNRMSKRYLIELFCDAAIVASLLVAGRYWLGHSAFGDGFGFLSAHIAGLDPGEASVGPHLFALVTVLFLAWLLIRGAAAWVGDHLFGSKNNT